MDVTGQKKLALEIWQAGVAAVGGYESVSAALAQLDAPRPDHIISVGKASVAMAEAALAFYGDVPALAVTKYGHDDSKTAGLEVLEAGHPVPDRNSIAAGRRLLETIAAIKPDERLLLLVSGGASALAEVPAEGLTLEDIAAENEQLLASGADIGAMNKHRRSLSQIKGGGLLEAFKGGSAMVLAISDVGGDDIAVIGSGIGLCPEQPAFLCASEIVASNTHARAAAAAKAGTLGLSVICNEETLHGDIADVASHVALIVAAGPSGAYVFGGEPTVILPENPGRGGRNQALALLMAKAFAGMDGIVACVGGTDGTDGPTDAAGAIIDGSEWDDAGGTDALLRADAGTWLDARDALLRTGPTGTNVADLAIIVKSN